MAKLVLLRHGESTANYDNTYTGWSDVPLTTNGVLQAHVAGHRLRAEQLHLTAVHTSMLKRAITTAYIVQEELGELYLPITKSWRLNERHYGALRGLNKDDSRTLFGAAQVAQWRRSYIAEPPHLVQPELAVAYSKWPTSIVPGGESLADAEKRLLPYWIDVIAPHLLRGEDQLIVAHGSTLRALIKYVEGIKDADIDGVEVGNAEPIVYTFDAQLHITTKNILHVD